MKNSQPSVCSTLLVSEYGITWRDSLPPLLMGRASPAVITVGRNPEYLVVVGGHDYSPAHRYLLTVEVLVEGQWCTIQPLP